MKRVVRLFAASLGLCVLRAWANEPTILVDQVGYERTADKQAIISGDAGQSLHDFQIVDTSLGKPVYSGTLRDMGSVYNWGKQHYWRADFSSLKTPGRYVLELKDRDGCLRSDEFLIQENHARPDVLEQLKGPSIVPE